MEIHVTFEPLPPEETWRRIKRLAQLLLSPPESRERNAADVPGKDDQRRNSNPQSGDNEHEKS